MQIFPTRMCNVTAWANDPSGSGLRGNSPGIAASPISLLSMGGVCGRSLTAGKIRFTGRQTCSLYLVLWLCDMAQQFNSMKCCAMYRRQTSCPIVTICPFHQDFLDKLRHTSHHVPWQRSSDEETRSFEQTSIKEVLI